MSDSIPSKITQGKKASKINVEDILPDSIKKITSTYGEPSVERLGFNGGNFPDCSPKYVPLKRAKVINKYDSYIVLGADAPNGPGSGYSAFGARCSSIDMVVGRLSANFEASTNPNIYAFDNYDLDAARVYVSQRTDVDKNFGIKNGNVGESEGRSAVAVKADAVRIIGREGIKLVTSPYGKYNSQTGKISTGYGIDLMARNDDTDMQPITKGDNLALVLQQMLEHIKDLYSTVLSVSQAQQEFAVNLAAHTHVSPVGPVAPSVELTPAAIKLSRNLIQDGILNSINESLNSTMAEVDFLLALGSDFINSDHNRTN
jgi:hypothetical protein